MRLTSVQLVRFGKWSTQFSNLPERYIQRAMNQVYWRNPIGPQYKPKAVIQRKKFYFGLHRPWTLEFKNQNQPGVYKPLVLVEPIKEWSFFRGDRVEVLVGKDKGKQGIVKSVIQERNWVTVEGLNCKLKNLGQDDKRDFEGVYIQEEQPLLVTTEVALVDPSDLKATAYEWRYTEEGEKVRVSARTGRIIPIPATAQETKDYKTKATYIEQPKDTIASEVAEVTFEPKLCTFEMDIMEKMNIKEDRIPPKSFWY
ncbi:large ribosomal subunit protein uL24m [Euwallacea fornicatus]|uniref:large ribosomal subunit protein uL24m n=1 Tax=Euwallacea fornicatus TaxID=995702 RepID=UPI003390526B